MYKLMLFMLVISLFMAMHALQVDEELAMHALFQGKRAVSRAAHAAAQQLDPEKLAEGTLSIDAVSAESEALRYLRANLRLDESNRPLPGTFWKTQAEVIEFVVINEDRSFPYTYIHAASGYTATLKQPGVVLMIRLEYPRTFQVLEPVVWEIKGTAELTF